MLKKTTINARKRRVKRLKIQSAKKKKSRETTSDSTHKKRKNKSNLCDLLAPNKCKKTKLINLFDEKDDSDDDANDNQKTGDDIKDDIDENLRSDIQKMIELKNANNLSFLLFNGFSQRFYNSFIKVDKVVNKKFLEFRENYRNKNHGLQFSVKKNAFYLCDPLCEGKQKFFKGLTKAIECKFGSPYGLGKTGKASMNDEFYLDALRQDSLNRMAVSDIYFSKNAGAEGVECTEYDNNSRMEHGSIVDRDLYFYVKYSVKRTSLHSCAARLLEFLLEEKQWIPLQSQLSIYNPTRAIASTIDLICYSVTEKRYKLLEIKTTLSSIFASDSYERNSHKVLKLGKNVGEIAYSAYINHQIQLLMLKSLFARRYIPRGMPFDYKLVRICKDGVKVYDEHSFTKEQKKAIIKIVNNRNRKRNSNNKDAK